jgi:Zn finger protein HypA/HybF involved in hydrogenase expression
VYIISDCEIIHNRKQQLKHMHETHILENIFKYLQERQDAERRKINKVYITIPEFSGIKEAHLREHFKEAASGTKWERLEVEVTRIPFGPELEITRIDFE